MSESGTWSAFFANAFAVERAEDFAPSAQEAALVARLVAAVHRRALTGPVLLALQSGQNLHFVTSQMLTAFAPFVQSVFTSGEYEVFCRLLERRGCIEYLSRQLEQPEDSRIDDPESPSESTGA